MPLKSAHTMTIYYITRMISDSHFCNLLVYVPVLRVPGERAEDPSPVPLDTAARTFGVLELTVDCAGEGLAAPGKLLPLVLADDPDALLPLGSFA